MVDPYQAKMAHKVTFTQKKVVKAKMVAVLKGNIEKRGIELIHPASRVVRKGDIFELMYTLERDAQPGEKVDSVTYLGFVEVEEAGVLRVDDIVRINNENVGTVIGFDETHSPNHLNVILRLTTDIEKRGIELKLHTTVEFILPEK